MSTEVTVDGEDYVILDEGSVLAINSDAKKPVAKKTKK
jgi:co-chaperonin GroES (HSP10)